ncbi:MAG: DUF3310 domain-containing protein [Bacteroidales bacterium]
MSDRIKLLKRVHERWKRKKEAVMAEEKIVCEVCRENKAAQYKWHGMVLCPQCVTVAEQIKKRKSAVHELYRKICGTDLADSAGVDAAPGDPEAYAELEKARADRDEFRYLLAKTAEAAGCAPGFDLTGLPAVAMELRQRTVVPDGEVCDPHTCDELAGAIKELLAVRQALGDYAPENEDPGALAGGVYLAVKAAREPTVQLDKYEGMLTEIALALDGWTGTCDWSTMVEQVRRLVESRVSTLETIKGPATGVQVGGRHYVDLAIGPTEYSQRNGLGCCESAVVKYVTRHKRKGGLEDIRKAVHYLQLLEEIEYPAQGKELVPPLPAVEHAEGVEHD